MGEYFSSPGRILGFILLLTTGAIWLFQEHKKNQERKARRLEKQLEQESQKNKAN